MAECLGCQRPRIGTIVLDEVVMRIDSIEIHSSMLWVKGHTHGDYTVRDNADVSIFGEDGSFVLHVPSRDGGNVSYSRGEESRMDVTLPISMEA